MSKAKVAELFILFKHKVPTHRDGGAHFHSSPDRGKLWMYCTKCQALGGVNEKGVVFGVATQSYCTGAQNVIKPVLRHVVRA